MMEALTRASGLSVRRSRPLTDTTIEKAGDLLRDSWRGLLLSRDELSGFLASMDRYSGGGDREFWLETFGGRSFTIDRKSSPEPIIVDHMSIAVLGGTQPDKLDSLVVGSADDGLLSRFLIVFPDPVPLERPSSVLDAGFVQNALERLHALEPQVSDKEEKTPVLVPLNEAAQTAFQAFRVQNRARETEVSGMMKSHIGKLPGLVLRTALVLALLDSVADEIGFDVESIDESHIERASLYVGQHLRQHAERTYGAAVLPPDRQAANRISEIILKEGMDQISTRNIQRRGLVGLLSAKEIGPAFAVLESADWIRQLPSNGPGRPSKRFAVNPKVKALAIGGMKGT